MELIDLYNFKKQLTGETMERNCIIPDNRYRLAVRVAIFNDENQILLQKRQDTAGRKKWDNLWDISAAGAVSAGENSNQAIQRELKEEVGIEYDFSKTRPAFSCSFKNGFDDVYVIRIDNLKLEDLILEEKEVSSVKWASQEEILEIIKAKEFVPFSLEFIGFIFAYAEEIEDLLDKSK